jgi:hypothetical protein
MGGERDQRPGREGPAVDERVDRHGSVADGVGDPLRRVDSSSGGVHVEDDGGGALRGGLLQAPLDERSEPELHDAGDRDAVHRALRLQARGRSEQDGGRQ